MGMGHIVKCIAAGTVAAAIAASVADAAENGNTQYAPGSPQFFAGQIPPYPGLYFLSQTSYFGSKRSNDGDGNALPIDFETRAIAETMRFLYVSDVEVGGATVWGQLVVPLVGLDLTVPFASDNGVGLGDVVAAAGLAWHPDRFNTFIFGIDVATPTGKYDENDFPNIGLNHWSLQPTVGYQYFDPQGFQIGATARVIFNTQNPDTDYKTGNELVVDYAVGWNFDKVRVGAVGYYLQQLTDDAGPTAPADGKRGKAFAIGPSLTYSFDQSLQVSASWQHDVFAENRAQGDTVWVNLATKF